MVKILSKEELEKLSTKRLLAYKNKLMKVPEEADWDNSNPNKIHKKHPIWKKVYQDVKDVLQSREHVEKKEIVEEVAEAINNMENEGGLPSGKK